MTGTGLKRLVTTIMGIALLIGVPHVVGKGRETVKQYAGQNEVITEGFQLALQAEDTIAYDDMILLKLELKNATKETLYVKETTPWYDYEVDVRDESEQRVQLTKKGEELEEMRKRWQEISTKFPKIKSGGVLTYSLDITGLYQIKPGKTYSLSVSRKVQKRRDQGLAELRSNIVKVKIVDTARK